MPYHNWSDDSVDWEGINDAARYIAVWLRRWARLPVRDYKEKFGTVRIYCGFGWHQLHDITHPGYCFSQYPEWLWHLDCRYIRRLMPLVNWAVVPVHRALYRWRYGRAIRKWPHLAGEILMGADWHEDLLGLDPNLHLVQTGDHSWSYWWTGYDGGRKDWKTKFMLEQEAYDEGTEALPGGRASTEVLPGDTSEQSSSSGNPDVPCGDDPDVNGSET